MCGLFGGRKSQVQQIIALEREVIETRLAATRIVLTVMEEIEGSSAKQAVLQRLKQFAEGDSAECARIGRLVVARAKTDVLQDAF